MSKFRSWNELDNQFYYFKGGEYYYDEACNNTVCFFNNCNGITFFDWQNAEQATGLFDKNGKEIYIGDKVKWKDYDHFGCCFEYESIVEQEKCGAYVTETPDGTGSYYVWGKADELEIIGNIYEGDK